MSLIYTVPAPPGDSLLKVLTPPNAVIRPTSNPEILSVDRDSTAAARGTDVAAPPAAEMLPLPLNVVVTT